MGAMLFTYFQWLLHRSSDEAYAAEPPSIRQPTLVRYVYRWTTHLSLEYIESHIVES